MAKVFLDVNVIIDMLEERKHISLAIIQKHEVYLSPLSIHIFSYVEKKTMPYSPLSEFLQNNNLVDLTESLTNKALIGPTNDFEDNVQLHSAAEVDCDIFLTSDKDLLDMKFFGKTQILPPENLK